MASSSILVSNITATPNYYNYTPRFSPQTRYSLLIVNHPITFSLSSVSTQRCVRVSSQSQRNLEEDEEEGLVQDLRVPQQWLDPLIAAEESEWLRITLHKWLDDEYCPEPTNIDISNIAAKSYYKSLVERETDLGEILLKMARDLESISYQESFHGAFSSANAAIDLIIQKIEKAY